MEEEQEQPRTSGLATASLILAITCIGAPIALILGVVALVQIAGNPRLRGQWLAISGIIISVLAVFVLLIVAAVSIPAVKKARVRVKEMNCLYNLKQLASAMQMYSFDYNGSLPPADHWNKTLKTYYKNPKMLVCPSDATGGPSYAVNNRVLQSSVTAPEKVVSFFDSVPGPNKAGGPELLPSPPRHGAANNFAFMDGHAASVEDTRTLVWGPGAPEPSAPVPPSGH